MLSKSTFNNKISSFLFFITLPSFLNPSNKIVKIVLIIVSGNNLIFSSPNRVDISFKKHTFNKLNNSLLLILFV